MEPLMRCAIVDSAIPCSCIAQAHSARPSSTAWCLVRRRERHSPRFPCRKVDSQYANDSSRKRRNVFSVVIFQAFHLFIRMRHNARNSIRTNKKNNRKTMHSGCCRCFHVVFSIWRMHTLTFALLPLFTVRCNKIDWICARFEQYIPDDMLNVQYT